LLFREKTLLFRKIKRCYSGKLNIVIPSRLWRRIRFWVARASHRDRIPRPNKKAARRRLFIRTNSFHHPSTRKATLLESTPLGVVTSIVPVVAPLGTVVSMKVPDTTVNVAGTPLNVTLVAPVRSLPRIPMTEPALPKVGLLFTKGPRPVDRL